MSKVRILFLTTLIFLSCDDNNLMNIINLKRRYKEIIELGVAKSEIIDILKNDNIEYSIFSHKESKNTSVREYIADGDFVLMFIYGKTKKNFIATYHSIYVIFNSNNKTKMVLFKENYLGP